MNYGNLAQTGAVATSGLAGHVAGGTWGAVAAVALVVGVMAAVKLFTPSAKARP